MGLLDNLGLGDMLKNLLGQAESGALPAMINAVLAKTNTPTSAGSSPRCRMAASTSKSNPGSGPAPIYRSPPSS